MFKRLLLLTIVILSLVFTGCGKKMPETPILPEVNFIQLETREGKGIPFGPSLIEINGVGGVRLVDTCTSDMHVQFEYNDITFKAGEPLALAVVNCTGEDSIYAFEFMDARKDVVFEDKGGYASAPAEAINWVYFPKEVLIQDGYAAKIPVIIYVPKGIELPERWAFRIGVSEVYTGFVKNRSTVYFLISK